MSNGFYWFARSLYSIHQKVNHARRFHVLMKIAFIVLILLF